MNVLIVEDDFVSRRLLQVMLGPYGQCDLASDGEEAMKTFKNAIRKNSYYDLICLDIEMPGMDGQQVLQEIRNFEKQNGICGLDHVKVIMISALKDPKNILNAFKEQADAYLVKPIDKLQLVEKLRQLSLFEETELV